MNNNRLTQLSFQIGRVFTPSVPINKRSLFAGRLDELRRILDAVSSPGKHAFLYGDRGVGKTSLATILKEWISETTNSDTFVSRVNCEPMDHFASVWDKALQEVLILIEEANGKSEHRLHQWLDLKEYVGPSQIRRVLQTGNESIPELVIVFDEFDRLAPEHRGKFADTIKDLADSLTSATVILIGVASDVTALIADHASIGRNLAQIKMPPMSQVEVREILDNGLRQLDMTMMADACDTIVTLAQGYPHYAHLLAKEAALSAVSSRRTAIVAGDVTAAIKVALLDVGYGIPDLYHKATLAQRKGTLFEPVLAACALAEVDEMGYFASTDVRPALCAMTGKQYEIYGFSQHLNKLATDSSRGPALEKRGSGRCYRYRFLEPLLRPYAIIKGMSDGLVTIDMLQRLDAPKAVQKKPPRKPYNTPAPRQNPTSPNLFDGC